LSLFEMVLFSGIVPLLGTLSQPNTGNYTPGHVSRYNPLATPLPERSGRGFWLLSTRRAASRMLRHSRSVPNASAAVPASLHTEATRGFAGRKYNPSANRSQSLPQLQSNRRKPTTTQAPLQTGRRSYNTSLPATSARAAGYFSSIQISGAPVAAIWSSVSSMPTMPTQ